MSNKEIKQDEFVETSQIIEPAISFKLQNQTVPFMEIMPNGDFYVKGNLVENDKEVFQAFKKWLILSGMISEEINEPKG